MSTFREWIEKARSAVKTIEDMDDATRELVFLDAANRLREENDVNASMSLGILAGYLYGIDSRIAILNEVMKWKSLRN